MEELQESVEGSIALHCLKGCKDLQGVDAKRVAAFLLENDTPLWHVVAEIMLLPKIGDVEDFLWWSNDQPWREEKEQRGWLVVWSVGNGIREA